MSSPPSGPGRHSHGDDREHLRDASGFIMRLERPRSSRRFFLGVRDATFSLYDQDDFALHFDLEWSLRRAFVGGVKFLRGIDGRVVRRVPATWRGQEVPSTSSFDARQVTELLDRMRAAVSDALASLDEEESAGDVEADRQTVENARRLLASAAGFTPDRQARERQRFLEAYVPIGILPPDRYRNLILQATTGRRYTRCAFCSIYRDSPYRPKSVSEFREHEDRVRGLFGRSLALKRGVFLAEANALELRTSDLESMIAIVREELPEMFDVGISARLDIAAFTDGFEGFKRPVSEIRRLAALGLRRVYIGVESGDEVTLRALRKPATRRTVLRRVRDLKVSGVTVGALLLAGAGGRQQTKEHVEGSLELVERMGLDDADLIYVSCLESTQESSFLDLFGRQSPQEIVDEERRLLTGLRGFGLRASRYDLGGFVCG